jgi:hypothetical protein
MILHPILRALWRKGSGGYLNLSLAAALGLLFLLPVASSPANPAPVLVEQGSARLIYAGWFWRAGPPSWPTPTPQFVKENIGDLEAQPFDGLVVYLRRPDLSDDLSFWAMSTNMSLSYDTAYSVMAPLRETTFTTLTDNLGLIRMPWPPDAFNDTGWNQVKANLGNLAEAAKNSGLKGFCFDNEQYPDYFKWGDYGEHLEHFNDPNISISDYQNKMYSRGKEIMQEMVLRFPAVVLLSLHGPYVSEGDGRPYNQLFNLAYQGNELLGSFFVGNVEGAGSTGCAMDGGELYHLREKHEYDYWANYRRNGFPAECPLVPSALKSVYPGRVSISFGVIDTGTTKTDFTKSLVGALTTADRYVWFYSEANTYLLLPGSGGAPSEWVQAIRDARSQAGSPPNGGGPDPMAAPSNLMAEAASTTSIDLTWQDNSTAENGFSIERWNGSAWVQIDWQPDNDTNYTNTGLTPGTVYHYRVLAFNATILSPPSNEAIESTPTTSGIPVAPTSLVLASKTSSTVQMAWTDNSSNENGFSIERQISGTWTQIGWVPDNVQEYGVTGLTANTAYNFRVLAFNGYGNSGTTNELNVTTSANLTNPAAPSGLTVGTVTSSTVALSWTDNASNENGYSIERLISSTWTQIGWVPEDVTTFTEIELTAVTAYSYRVLAFNGLGLSPTSNQVSATTLPASGSPNAPSNLFLDAATSSSLTLRWSDNAFNENGFSIERLKNSVWTQIGWVPENTVTFTESGLSVNSTHSYRVLAFNGSGLSGTTNTLNATTLSTPSIPNAPTNLVVNGMTSSTVTLSWTDNSFNENGFSIERQIGGTWTQIGWVPEDVRTFTDTGLASGTSYSYRVVAFNASDLSAPTNVVNPTTP